MQKRKYRRRTGPYNELGLTIVELMIVLTILAAIMGVIAYNMKDVIGTSDRKLAQIEAGRLSEMVTTRYGTTSPHEYPESLDELTTGPQKLTDEIPLDPWGNAYVYRVREDGFDLFSSGPDGQEGTDDDVGAAPH